MRRQLGTERLRQPGLDSGHGGQTPLQTWSARDGQRKAIRARRQEPHVPPLRYAISALRTCSKHNGRMQNHVHVAATRRVTSTYAKN